MLKLHDEGHLYSNLLFYILAIYRKCLLFQFSGVGTHMQIPILTEVQNGRLICEENYRIFKFFEMKSLVCQLLLLCSDLLPQIPSFPVL